jgi:hypothetical protein
VTAVLAVSALQVHRHYTMIAQAPAEHVEAANADGANADAANANSADGANADAANANGANMETTELSSNRSSDPAVRNYQVVHQERLNDGIHTTNENQRNGALESVMREIADYTSR